MINQSIKQSNDKIYHPSSITNNIIIRSFKNFITHNIGIVY